MPGMNSHAHVPEWTLVSLRPRGQHAAMRRAAQALGGQLLPLSPWALRARDDAATRSALIQALQADRVVFTSPGAAHAAARLASLSENHPGQWLAVGAGTAAALRHHGAMAVRSPERMDSEGLLGLPELADLHGLSVALVTAPGGRGLIAPTLDARGAALQRVDVYTRSPLRPAPRAVQRLRRQTAPWVLALSSAEALGWAVSQLPDDVLTRLRGSLLVAASARLAELAGAEGFTRIQVAQGPQPLQLAQAARAFVTARAPD